MSAALQFPLQPLPSARPIQLRAAAQPTFLAQAVKHIQKRLPPAAPEPGPSQTVPAETAAPDPDAINSWAFYRKHTENLLRRYLYASFQVSRSPNLLGESVGRGWVSSRPVRTFEDALIFVLDVERCLNRLPALDRQIISRIVLQEYTFNETATYLNTSPRTVCHRLPQALDRLTEDLVNSHILTVPN